VSVIKTLNDVGVPEEIINDTLTAINTLYKTHPRNNITVQSITKITRHDIGVTKKILYVLLGLRKITATYLPRHKKCNKVIGAEETSVEVIQHMANNNAYICGNCIQKIWQFQEVDVEILFWPLGFGK